VTSPDAVAFTRHGPSDVSVLADHLVELYRVVYAEPPYFERAADVLEFTRRLDRQVAEPGFALVAGWSGQELVGYVFGFTLTARSTVWETILTSGGQLPAAGSAAGPAYVSELLVRSNWRRQGVGRSLLDRFLADRGESHAILLAHPDAAAAQAAYARWGWREIGWGRPFPHSPRYLTLLLAL